MKLLFSILTRSNKKPESLQKLLNWIDGFPQNINVTPILKIRYDPSSIYEGHNANINSENLDENSCIVMCHDDIEILSTHNEVVKYLELCLKDKVGYLGVAGCTRYDNNSMNGAWWNARSTGDTRGFVFQGNSNETMTANPFGSIGQCIVMDGVFLAISYKNYKKLGFNKPHYIKSDFDFYDVQATFNSHLSGYNNYVIPVLIRHESPGILRPEWLEAKNNFCKYHNQNLPCYIPHNKTHGLPK